MGPDGLANRRRRAGGVSGGQAEWADSSKAVELTGVLFAPIPGEDEGSLMTPEGAGAADTARTPGADRPRSLPQSWSTV